MPRLMNEDDLTKLMLYAVAEAMMRQVLVREKPKSARHTNAERCRAMLEKYSSEKWYPGNLPDGYADVLEPFFDKLGEDINKFLVDYESFSVDKTGNT